MFFEDRPHRQSTFTVNVNAGRVLVGSFTFGIVTVHWPWATCTWVISDYYKCMNLMQDPCNMMGMAISLGDPSCAAGMNNSACTTGQ